MCNVCVVFVGELPRLVEIGPDRVQSRVGFRHKALKTTGFRQGGDDLFWQLKRTFRLLEQHQQWQAIVDVNLAFCSGCGDDGRKDSNPSIFFHFLSSPVVSCHRPSDDLQQSSPPSQLSTLPAADSVSAYLPARIIERHQQQH